MNAPGAEPLLGRRPSGGPVAAAPRPALRQPRGARGGTRLEWNHLLVHGSVVNGEDCLHCVGDLEVHGMSLRPCSAQRRCLRTV